MLSKILIVPKSIIKKISLVFLIAIIISVVINIFFVGNVKNNFPNNYLYVSQNNEQIEEYLNNNNIFYCKTRQLNVAEGEGSSIEREPYELKQKIYMSEIAYNADTSKMTIMQNKNNTRKNASIKVYVNYLFDCSLRQNVQIQENQEGIALLVKGTFPKNKDEVLISENYALKLISESDQYKNYNDLIGQTIKISTETGYDDSFSYQDRELVVSGIYAGGNDLYILPPDETKSEIINRGKNLDNALFIEFPSKKDKKDFLNKFNEIQYLDSKNINSINIYNVLKFVVIALSIIVSILLLNNDLKELLFTLNYHEYSKLNYIYIYFWLLIVILPLLIILL